MLHKYWGGRTLWKALNEVYFTVDLRGLSAAVGKKQRAIRGTILATEG